MSISVANCHPRPQVNKYTLIFHNKLLICHLQDRAMALALQEQLNMEESGGNAAAMAYQPGQPMAVAPAAMIGRLTGTH